MTPMRKWCRRCEKFKPNPKNKRKPKYCDECIQKIYIAARVKRKETIAKRKNEK